MNNKKINIIFNVIALIVSLVHQFHQNRLQFRQNMADESFFKATRHFSLFLQLYIYIFFYLIFFFKSFLLYEKILDLFCVCVLWLGRSRFLHVLFVIKRNLLFVYLIYLWSLHTILLQAPLSQCTFYIVLYCFYHVYAACLAHFFFCDHFAFFYLFILLLNMCFFLASTLVWLHKVTYF